MLAPTQTLTLRILSRDGQDLNALLARSREATSGPAWAKRLNEELLPAFQPPHEVAYLEKLFAEVQLSLTNRLAELMALAADKALMCSK